MPDTVLNDFNLKKIEVEMVIKNLRIWFSSPIPNSSNNTRTFEKGNTEKWLPVNDSMKDTWERKEYVRVCMFETDIWDISASTGFVFVVCWF